MNSADGYLAVVMFLLGVVFFGLVPMVMIFGQLVFGLLQVLCIGTVSVCTWRKLTVRGTSVDNRIGLTFLAYIAASAVTNIIWWFSQPSGK